MVDIVTRQTQLTNLTHSQVDQNFLNLKGAIEAIVDSSNQLAEALQAPTGSSLVGFMQPTLGAVERDWLDRGKDWVNVCDFMTPDMIAKVRAGIPVDVSDSFQAACNSFTVFAGTVELPPGNIRINKTVTTSIKGLRITGASRYGTYITTPSNSTFDMIRVAHQQVEICNILFRPGGVQNPVVLYAGRAHIHDCYMLPAVNGQGVGVLMTDTDPVTGAVIAGAYNHVVENCIFGDAGYAFARGVTETSQFGITSSKVERCTFYCDRPVQIMKGGGNTYIGNLMQSATGAFGSQVGVGFTFGPGVVGEKVIGNYMELFAAMIETQNPDETYQTFYAVGNHNDNCGTSVADAGGKNYVIEDTATTRINNNGWSTRQTATQWGVNARGGKNTFGADLNGNCFMGASTGASHVINKNSMLEGDVLVAFQASGLAFGYIQNAQGGPMKGTAACLSLNKNTVSGRSIGVVGTVVTDGNDYAEYMSKANGCGTIEKGQIVGIDSDGNLTDKWSFALTFVTKSTAPSYVGGDTWFNKPLPMKPGLPDIEKPVPPRVKVPFPPAADASDDEVEAYQAAREEYERVSAQASAEYEVLLNEYNAAIEQYNAAIEQYAAHVATYKEEYETARQKVDRVAFAGQVPVNVWGAQPGQHIVPVRDGDGIKGVAMNESDMALSDYMRAIGKVIAIETDGRARIIVKVS